MHKDGRGQIAPAVRPDKMTGNDGTEGTIEMRNTLLVLSLLALFIGGQAARAGEVLIKPTEAALPPAPAAARLALRTRGLTRRPNVIVVSPSAAVSSPFTLRIKFKAHGRSTIKPNLSKRSI